MQLLVINSGSSSLKFEVFDADDVRSLAAGEVQRIGPRAEAWVRDRSKAPGAEASRRVSARDHREAFRVALDLLSEVGCTPDAERLGAVGHRVVHGGERFTDPVLLDDAVVQAIGDLALLAPLHAKANVAGIDAARALLPGVPHVAVFDTAFHRTMPPFAAEYALPRDLTRGHGIRRYGFHGISHSYVARRAASVLGRGIEELRLITVHLGNGASMAAIDRGRSVDTSMGMTPLEGLVMGTRCGDVDPAVPMLLGELTGRTREEVHSLMNFESGLKGLTGEADMREVHRMAEAGDADAALALDVYCYRVRKYLGAYYAVLGHVDAVVFTAGVGEHDAEVRERICTGLERLGIAIDKGANAEPPRAASAGSLSGSGGGHADILEGERVISPVGAEVAVLIIPTDEESEIARATMRTLQRRPAPIGSSSGR